MSDNAMNSGAPGLPAQALANLKKSAPWVRFFGVLGWIMIGLLGLGSLIMMGISLTNSYGGPGLFFGGLLYMGMVGVFIYPTILLNQLAGITKTLGADGKEADLNLGTNLLHRVLRYWGVLTIVILSLYLVALLLLPVFISSGRFGSRFF